MLPDPGEIAIRCRIDALEPGQAMRGKVIAQTTMTGQEGVNLVERIVMGMGFVWYPTGSVEAGIDGFIELRDKTSETVTNTFIAVQSKAVGGNFANETDTSLDYHCEARDLDYWMKGNIPVLLVVSRPKTDEAYWLSVKDYFRDPARRLSRKAHFDKHTDRFDASCAGVLRSLALPKDAGIYLAPPPKRELVISNLLPLAFHAQRIFMAETESRSPRDLWQAARDQEVSIGGEWILRNRRIVTFHDLTRSEWRGLSDRGTVEDFSVEEWSQSQDRDRVRDFVDLLRRTLREMVYHDLNYDRRKEYYFFRPSEKLDERTFSYRALQRETSRAVFSPYYGRDRQISYYRHSAFFDRFHRFDGQWYLEVTPTYHFTHDGYRTHRRASSLLMGIKQIEKHEAVRGQVIMWAAYLTPRADMLRVEPYPFLGFWDLRAFPVESGIADGEWDATRSSAKEDAAEGEQEQSVESFDLVQGSLLP